MPIQIVIRRQAAAHEPMFAAGDLRTLAEDRIRIGRAPECECAVAAEEFPEVAVTLHAEPGKRGWTLHPAAGVALTLNGKPVTGAAHVHSGDEIACGVWSFRVHKVQKTAGHSRRADALAFAAKLIIGLILVTEAGLISWLPHQIQTAQMWELQTARQRANLYLDSLRNKNGKAKPATAAELAARKFVGARLDDLARYLRRNQDRLNRNQLRAVQEDLEMYDDVLRRLPSGRVIRDVPPLAVDAGVQAAVGNRTP